MRRELVLMDITYILMPQAYTCIQSYSHTQTVTCHRACDMGNVTISVVMVTTWLGDSNLCVEYRSWLMMNHAA